METDTRPTCPQCGARNDDGRPRCHACGVELRWGGVGGAQPAFELFLEATRGGRGKGNGGRPSLFRRAWGGLAAAGETAAAVTLAPERTFRSFRLEGGAGRPLAFSILLGGPCALLGAALRAALSGEAGALSGPKALTLAFVAPVLYVYLRAQVLHLALVLRGQAREPFEVTLRITGYSNGSVAPLLLVPYAGELLFLAAGAVVEATGLRVCHRLTPGGAALVEVAPAVVLFTGLLAGALTGLLWWSQTRG